MLEPEAVGDHKEAVSSGITLGDVMSLNLCKSKPDLTQAWRGKLGVKFCTYSQSCWQLFAAGRKGVSVLWECSLWKVNHTPVEGHMSKNIWTAQVGLDGAGKKRQSCVGRVAMDLGEAEGRRGTSSKHIPWTSQRPEVSPEATACWDMFNEGSLSKHEINIHRMKCLSQCLPTT